MSPDEKARLLEEARAIQKAIANTIDMTEKARLKARYEEIRRHIASSSSLPVLDPEGTGSVAPLSARTNMPLPIVTPKQATNGFGLTSAIGALLALIGFIGMFYFAFQFQIAADNSEVINLGLISDREIGALTSVTCVISGSIVFATGEIVRSLQSRT